MNLIKHLYSGSLSLLTDLYQITMAYGYWRTGRHNQQAVFNLFFRQNPFDGGYTLSCGLAHAIDYIENFSFTKEDLSFLSKMKGNDGKLLFDKDFIKFLSQMKLECDVEAIPEGSVVFPNEPLLRIKGPIYQCQLLETPLLNIINFQTLIATKAARIKHAAGSNPVMEFGLRRAQGIDGSLSASRAAFIGGCDSTSNVLAGKLFDIPVAGTHAHSWVMSFENEEKAFKSYAEAMPNNIVFLVDTYDTIEGIQTAISVGNQIRESGAKLYGIRLDSGDLAYFGSKARKMLDKAGFKETKIIASNDLDEYLITSLENQKSHIEVWGVGTKLVTAFDQPALGGVYKLAAIKDKSGKWVSKVKLSEQAIKVNNPGIQQIRRFTRKNKFVGDMIYEHRSKPEHLMIDPLDITKTKSFNRKGIESHDLLVSIFQKGKLKYKTPSLSKIKEHVTSQLNGLDKSIKRFEFPHRYPVGLERNLFEHKNKLIMELRNKKSSS